MTTPPSAPSAAAVPAVHAAAPTAEITNIGRGPCATVSKIQPVGEGRLYYGSGGVFVPLDFDGGDNNESKHTKQARERVEKSLEEIWQGVIENLPGEATQLKVNLSELYIAYTVLDEAGNEVVKRERLENMPPQLKKLMQEARTASKAIWRNVNFGAVFGSQANRSLSGNKPFERVSERWAQLHPHSLGQFVQNDFNQMYEFLEDPANGNNARGEEAFKRVVAAEAYIQALLREVSQHKEDQRAALQSESVRRQPDKARLSALRQSLAQLEKLEAELRGIDRYPVYWAVGVCGDTRPKDAQERCRIADEISTGVRVALTRKVRPGEISRLEGLANGAKAFLHLNKDEESARVRGLGPFVASYALDAGDLAIYERLELAGRLDEDGRPMKGVSMEEFVTHRIIHLGDPNFKDAEALASLGVVFDDVTQAALLGGMDKATTAAEKAVQEVDRNVGSGDTAEERIKALKDSDLGNLLGDIKK